MTQSRRLVTAETDRTCPQWCDPQWCTIDVAAAGGCHQSAPVFVAGDNGQPVASVFLRQFPFGHLQTVFAMRGDSLSPGAADRMADAILQVNAMTR